MNRDELEHSLELRDGQRKSPPEFWGWMGILFLAIQCVVGLAQIVLHPWWLMGYLWFAIALFLFCWMVIVAPRAHERTLDALQRAAQELEFHFSTEGLSIHREDCDVHIAWSAVQGFRDSESLILLYWENQEFPISRRWFANDSDFTRFVMFLGHKSEMLS